MPVIILNFLKGYISVRASGGFNERLINLCSSRGIPVWDISYVGDTMFFFTKPKYYRNLKLAAKDSGADISVHGRFGLPFFALKNRDRIALAVGMIFVLCFIVFMSTRIWSIRVTGNDKLFDSEITEKFEELGVKIGARKKDIDILSVQSKVLSEFDNKIIWVSLNLEGMCAEIQVRESVITEKMSDGKPCNIVAAFDGTIKTLKTYAGTQIESIKNGVKEGDLLISGVVEYYDGALDFVEARGEVTAEHTVNIKSDISSVSERKYTHSKEYMCLSAFTLTVPFGKSSDESESEITASKQSAELNGVTLPFSLTRYVQSFYEPSENEDLIRRKYLVGKYIGAVADKTKNSDVISVKSRLSGKGKDLKLTGEIRCVDYVGKSVPISIKNE